MRARTRKLVESIVPAPYKSSRLATAAASLAAAGDLSTIIARDRRSEREPLSTLQMKTRVALRNNVSLMIKKEEMGRLESELVAREKALERAEQTLEEDAVHFDAFLANNEKVAQAAAAKADVATTLKVDKSHEVKKVKNTIAVLAVDKGRQLEALAEKRSYQQFLDSLTPPEHFQEVSARQEARSSELRAAALVELKEQHDADLAQRVVQLHKCTVAERAAHLKLGKAFTMPDVNALALASMPPAPTLAMVPKPVLSAAELEVPVFFTNPEQLMAVFQSAEDRNLFLIQQCQDTEQALEEISVAAADMAAAAARADAAHAETVAVLHAKINTEEWKISAMAMAPAPPSQSDDGGAAPPRGSLLDAIQPLARARIVQSFARAGFKPSASSDIVSMLTAMEAKLESLIARFSLLEPAYVAAKLKEREKERRTLVREARLKSAQELHEMRMDKMIKNALAPAAKRLGKPVMYRSIIPSERDWGHVADGDEGSADDDARFFE